MKRLTAIALSCFIVIGMVVPANATEMVDEDNKTYEQELVEERIVLEPLEAPETSETTDEYYVEEEELENLGGIEVEYADDQDLLNAPTGDESAYSSVAVTYDTSTTSQYSGWYRRFYAKPPMFNGFWDDSDYYNVAYRENSYDESTIFINRYDANMNLIKKVSITPQFPIYGNVIGDGNYYYVVTGKVDTNSENIEVLSIDKYDYNGNFVAECRIKGYDCQPDYYYDVPRFATKIPFDAGSCSLAIQNGVLSCNFAREMYSGHQSNFIFYVDTASMDRINAVSPYCSHSFDQAVLPTSDGGFLYANHGDASKRGFVITKVDASRRTIGEIIPFHFREGASRSSGYNETFAQLGGLAETSNSYLLCGASEKTLSYEPAPSTTYYGKNEARNLFVQVIRKDFGSYTGRNVFRIAGETRAAIGTKPDNCPYTLYLGNNIVDYGVIWLTDYTSDYYVNNPKVVYDGCGHIVFLWEKVSYASYSSANGTTYYAVYDEDMCQLIAPTELPQTRLTGNSDVACHDGKLYWPTKDEYGSYIRILDIAGRFPSAQVESYSVSLDGTIGLNHYISFGDKMTNDEITVIATDSTGDVIFNEKMIPSQIKKGDYYFVTVPIAAKKMNDKITLKLYQNGKLEMTNEYSLRKYADYILSHSNSPEYSNSVELVKAMLNYGGYAQEYFGYNVDSLANSGVFNSLNPVENGDVSVGKNTDAFISDNCNEIEFMGASLVCEGATSLRLYYSLSTNMTQSEFERKYSLSTALAGPYTSRRVEVEGDYFVVTIGNIPAQYLDNEFMVKFTDTQSNSSITVVYNPLVYIGKAQNGSNVKLKNLARSIYYFNKEAKNYIQ